MNFTDDMKLEGILQVFRYFPDGTKDVAFNGYNILTLASKQAQLLGIYTAAVVSDPVNRLHVGTGGCIDPQGIFPKQENPAWTNLNIPLLDVPTTYTTDLTIPQVTFLADLDQGTGNGSLITEAGLWKTSGLIFNVKTFPGIPKTSEFSLHFSWTIKFA